jgi:hypothetical protein
MVRNIGALPQSGSLPAFLQVKGCFTPYSESHAQAALTRFFRTHADRMPTFLTVHQTSGGALGVALTPPGAPHEQPRSAYATAPEDQRDAHHSRARPPDHQVEQDPSSDPAGGRQLSPGRRGSSAGTDARQERVADAQGCLGRRNGHGIDPDESQRVAAGGVLLTQPGHQPTRQKPHHALTGTRAPDFETRLVVVSPLAPSRGVAGGHRAGCHGCGRRCRGESGSPAAR